MKELLGKVYITQKEASHRYGYSQSWFKLSRYNQKGPTFIQINHGKIYYPLEETDTWFDKNIIIYKF